MVRWPACWPARRETLRKMLLAVVGDPRLVVARLAEQLVRARHARDEVADEATAADRDWKSRSCTRRWPTASGMWSLKWELEDLAFRAAALRRNTSRSSGHWPRSAVTASCYIDEVKQVLAAELARAGIDRRRSTAGPSTSTASTGRCSASELAFEQVFDVRAVRIIVGTVAECYAALGVVHNLWPFLPSEFDDYIATPKDNNYQSIHTAVSGPDGRAAGSADPHQRHAGPRPNWVWPRTGATRKAAATRRYDEKIQQVRELLQGAPGAAADELARLSRRPVR